jgi:hypothetical protein
MSDVILRVYKIKEQRYTEYDLRGDKSYYIRVLEETVCTITCVPAS